MDSEIINKNGLRKNIAIKRIQRMAKAYYGDKLFSKDYSKAKAKIGRFTDVKNIMYISLVENHCEKDYVNEVNRANLINLCEQYNLTGGSGNGFPTVNKLKAYGNSEGILLINGVECDPGLVQDTWLYRNEMDIIKKGVDILKKCFSFKRIVLATKEPVKNDEIEFEQVKIKDIYPMGYENFLIKSIFDINITGNNLPISKGILVLNLQTVYDIGEIFLTKSWIRSKYITVSNMENGSSVVVKVPIGIEVLKVFKVSKSKLGTNECNIYVGGGALRCHKLKDDECIDETTSYIVNGKMPDYISSEKCGLCRRCTNICPMGVVGDKIVKYVDKNGMTNTEKCSIYHPERCIGCGSCTFVCKAGKDVRAIIWSIKEEQY